MQLIRALVISYASERRGGCFDIRLLIRAYNGTSRTLFVRDKAFSSFVKILYRFVPLNKLYDTNRCCERTAAIGKANTAMVLSRYRDSYDSPDDLFQR